MTTLIVSLVLLVIGLIVGLLATRKLQKPEPTGPSPKEKKIESDANKEVERLQKSHEAEKAKVITHEQVLDYLNRRRR